MESFLINVILGDRIFNDLSNIENFRSNIIPPIGSFILTKGFGRSQVKSILIDYTNIQHEKEEDRGNEIIFVFI